MAGRAAICRRAAWAGAPRPRQPSNGRPSLIGGAGAASRAVRENLCLRGGASTQTGLGRGAQTWVGAPGQRCPNDINSLRDLEKFRGSSSTQDTDGGLSYAYDAYADPDRPTQPLGP